MIKIAKNIAFSSVCLTSKAKMRFAWEQQVKQIKSLSTRFQLNNFYLTVSPMHPQIIKNKSGYYQVRVTSHVLGLNFVPMTGAEHQQQAWRQRKYFNLRFGELGKLLDVIPGSQRQQTISRTMKDQQKHFLIKDLGRSKRKIEFQIRNGSNEKNIQPQLVAEIVLHALIKGSLSDLSGWSLAMDLERQKMLGELSQNFKYKKKEALDLTQE